MTPPFLTKSRATTAIVAGVAADLIQLPLTLGFLSGVFSVQAEALDLLIDIGMAGLTTSLLGFHWTLLPTALIETVPGLDVAPTWTACVSYVVWKRTRPSVTDTTSSAVTPGAISKTRSPSGVT